jgi:hypothetical protein
MASRRQIKESDDEPDEDDSGERRPAGGRSRMQLFKAWFRDARFDLYFLFFVGSVVLFVLGTAGVFARNLLGSGLADWFRSIGGFTMYLFVLGLLLLGASAYLFGGLVLKRNEFQRLVSTKSKSDFVRTLDRVERLAFELGTKESEIVADKKREFKVRH